jgi:hypothetical protein
MRPVWLFAVAGLCAVVLGSDVNAQTRPTRVIEVRLEPENERDGEREKKVINLETGDVLSFEVHFTLGASTYIRGLDAKAGRELGAPKSFEVKQAEGDDKAKKGHLRLQMAALQPARTTVKLSYYLGPPGRDARLVERTFNVVIKPGQ